MKATIPEKPDKIKILILALRELGVRQLGWYAVYQAGLISGYYRWRENLQLSVDRGRLSFLPGRLFNLPSEEILHTVLHSDGEGRLLAEAEEILEGRYRQFGAHHINLDLRPPPPLLHWSLTSKFTNPSENIDIKFTWEPARFGWATVLARAYAVSQDERFSSSFWERLLAFLDANPPYLGANWASAQEVALRLIALSFCWRVFSSSPHSTAANANRLAQAIREHAARISLTLAYARAQNNNHLLSEAAGLYTAALILPDHPSAQEWQKKGWHLFHQGIGSQINIHGEYIQHSTNYTRLMLQLALWVHALSSFHGEKFPETSGELLAAATCWLLKLQDKSSGQVPNLGPNDGAYILPLTVLPYEDYRPVLQAASSIFLDQTAYDAGPWDEMGLWFGAQFSQHTSTTERPQTSQSIDLSGDSDHPIVVRSPGSVSWAYLRTAHFEARPGHADQLHVDLWWRGLNLALDPGTYLYNASPPWTNALAGSEVHNTVTVGDRDQMQRAGRFLYLDWAQADLVSVERDDDGRIVKASAEHDGYRRLGVIHRRCLQVVSVDQWIVEDRIFAHPDFKSTKLQQICSLNWLLPDMPWEISKAGSKVSLKLTSPLGLVVLELSAVGEFPADSMRPLFLIARAGSLIYGAGDVKPHWGWYSPTYAEKKPALAVRMGLQGTLPITFRSEWKLV